MDIIKKMILTFVLSIAGITICTALFVTLFYSKVELSIILIWEIIAMSAVCSFGNLIFYSKSELSKNQMKIRSIIHFIYINAIVFGGAFLWKWITPGFILQLAIMFILIAAVYAGVMYVNLKKEEKTAEDLNQRLREYNSSEDEKSE